MLNKALMPGFIKQLDRMVRYLENGLVALAGLMVILAMLVTCADVFMRYVLSSPLFWSFDFIVLYLLPGSYFLSFSYALRMGAHLKVDFFSTYINDTVRRFFLFIVGLLSVVLFTYIAWFYQLEGYHAWFDGEVMAGVIAWPMWPTDIIVSMCFFVFALRLLITSCGFLTPLRGDVR